MKKLTCFLIALASFAHAFAAITITPTTLPNNNTGCNYSV